LAHILCECETLASLRHVYLGSFLEPEDIMSKSLGAIWNFSKVTGLSHKLIWGTKGLLIKAKVHRDCEVPNPFVINQSISQSVSQPASQSVSQSFSHSINQVCCTLKYESQFYFSHAGFYNLSSCESSFIYLFLFMFDSFNDAVFQTV